MHTRVYVYVAAQDSTNVYIIGAVQTTNHSAIARSHMFSLTSAEQRRVSVVYFRADVTWIPLNLSRIRDSVRSIKRKLNFMQLARTSELRFLNSSETWRGGAFCEMRLYRVGVWYILRSEIDVLMPRKGQYSRDL